MEVPCLYRNPKQCFVVISDPIKNKIVSHPIDILDWETCQESYGEASCKESYYVKCDPTRVVDHVGAPLLCAENGSITLREVVLDISESLNVRRIEFFVRSIYSDLCYHYD